MTRVLEHPTAWPVSGSLPGEADAPAGASLDDRLRSWAGEARVGLWLAAGLGAWALSALAIGLSRYPGQVAALWYTNVWGLVCLLVVPVARWPGLLAALAVGIVSANLGFGDSPSFAFALALPNLVEMGVGALLLLRHGRYPELTRSVAVTLQAIVRAALVPALVGAAIASLLFTGLGLPSPGPGLLALTWVESSLTGSATLLPLGLALLVSEIDELRAAWRDPQTWGCALLCLGVALFAVLLLPFPFIYVMLPLTLAAIRLPYVVVAACAALDALLIGLLLAQGLFPVPPRTAEWQQLFLYTPLLVAVVPPLLLAASAGQVQRQHVLLARSRERFRALYERTPAMMVSVDRSGRMIGASRLWLQRMGLTHDQVLGRRLDDFLVASSRAPQERPNWPQIFATGECSEIELRLQRPDGSGIDVLMSARTDPGPDGRVRRAHLVLEDITRKLLAEQLAAEHVRSQVTLESIADAVMTTDAQGRIDYLNPVALALLGHPSGQLIGRRYGEVLRRREVDGDAELPDPVAICLQQRRRLVAPQRVRLARADGREHVVQEAVSPMLAEGRLVGVVAVLHDVTAAHELALTLAHRAQHDALTGLPNRLLLHDRLVHGLQLARRNRHGLALIFIDLDGFKPVNDQHGHAVGDSLLCQVAERLLEQLRASDTACRLGGDEFVVLLPQTVDDEAVAKVARNLLEAVARPYTIGGRSLQVSASVGIACFPRDGIDEAALMRQADAAMYAAKQAGRGQLRFAHRALDGPGAGA